VAFYDGGILRFFSRPRLDSNAAAWAEASTINRAKALAGPLFLAARDHALVKIGITSLLR
jgi:hypothetical protein